MNTAYDFEDLYEVLCRLAEDGDTPPFFQGIDRIDRRGLTRAVLVSALESLKTLRDAIRHDHPQWRKDHGICDNLHMLSTMGRPTFDVVMQIIGRTRWIGWPLADENRKYPVPGGFAAFCEACETGRLWKGKNGELRVKLVNHLIRELERICFPNEVECCHADTCLPDFWGGHHLPHVSVPVWRGMTLKELREALAGELRDGAVGGSTYEARLLSGSVIREEEEPLADRLTVLAYRAIEQLATDKGRSGRQKLFKDLDHTTDDDCGESVYAYFVFRGLEA